VKQLVIFFTSLMLIALQPATGQHFKSVGTSTGSSFRGLSVADGRTAWVSGSKGYVGISNDAGNTWAFRQVKGYEQCDFRSIYAFDERRAVIANAGAPAYILTTTDGGQNWKLVYENKDSAAFIDGLCFWDNSSGIVYGDPIGGRLLTLTTADRGQTWRAATVESRPALEKDEASFAASGTAMRCLDKSKVIVATGGGVSRLLTSDNKGGSWNTTAAPMLHGMASTGIFSVACVGNNMIIAGGDYKREDLRTDHIFISKDAGKHWVAPAMPTRGYRECVEFVKGKTAIATGPSGTDISYDLGMHWQPLSDEKQFHVVRKSRKGNLIIMAGGNGKIAIVTL
jgi:photosystem II stability/assembly factor-like uncharacterized protein